MMQVLKLNYTLNSRWKLLKRLVNMYMTVLLLYNTFNQVYIEL